MTFATRDHYRHVAEQVAKRSGLGEVEVAARAVSLAADALRRDPEDLRRAAERLGRSRRTLLYAGNGARPDSPLLVSLAERLAMPVATTIQGKGVFPETHPLWLWNGFGLSAPAFARAFAVPRPAHRRLTEAGEADRR